MNKLLILLLTSILTLTAQTYTIGDTLTFEVKGLVCSFCAHGLNKGIGKMDYTDENNVFVDIKKQIVKVVILKKPSRKSLGKKAWMRLQDAEWRKFEAAHQRAHSKRGEHIIEETIKVITNSGYDVSRITHANEVIWKKEK